MARTINSPGIQIRESDLSLTQQAPGGTNVFVAGFASQGPTDEVLAITTASELEQVYGAPQTPAERYFHYTAKEVLNSPATLLTTRLPYGSGSGEGFGSQYSALFYPVNVNSLGTGYNIGTPTVYNLTETQYDDLLQNYATWDTSGGVPSDEITLLDVVPTLSTVNALESVSAAVSAALEIDPGVVLSSVELTFNPLDVDFTFTYNLSTFLVRPGGTAYYNPATNFIEAGLVVLNKSQTTINQNFEGYYITITDNAEFGPDTDFTSVNTLRSYSDYNTLYNVPDSVLGFSLSGKKENVGTNSISEIIETVPTFNFGDDYYKDSVLINILKVRRSIYEPQLLTYSIAESHIGSFDSQKKSVANIGGIQKSAFIENVVNDSSSNIHVLVNPNISTKTNWSGLSSVNPEKMIRVAEGAKSVNPVGVYSPTFDTSTEKYVGEVDKKLERALVLIEATDGTLVDLIVDAGLSTIYATTNNDEAFDDTKFQEAVNLTTPGSSLLGRWRTMFNIFDNFARNIRQDCMFISDPVRQIFINGENSKTMSVRANTFSTNIYTPLKNSYGSIDSSYSAAYANWIKQYDPYADKQVWLPSSGYVAATIARSDDAAQPWIAPAGLTRGKINNITDIAFNPNQKQRDFLYTISLNPIVGFQGDGFVVFGQKTLQTKPTAFDRINVRRLFLTLERAVAAAVKYYVFEPNSNATRTRLKNTIRPIFDLAKNTDGLYDYQIVCDERNNPSSVVDRNELIVDVYLKPVKSAEYILVNFIATRTSQSFSELI